MSTYKTTIKAIHFAAIKHKDQRRKNDTKDPYINHPIDTTHLASLANIEDHNILSACALHDTIEDTKTTKEELNDTFGPIITGYVLEVTDDKNLSKPDRKRKQIEKSLVMSDGAKCVKLADKLSNLSSMLRDPPSSWTSEYIIGSTIWMRKITNNIISTVTTPTLIEPLKNLKEMFDDTAKELLAKYGIDYNNIQNENEILEHYISVLCAQ